MQTLGSAATAGQAIELLSVCFYVTQPDVEPYTRAQRWVSVLAFQGLQRGKISLGLPRSLALFLTCLIVCLSVWLFISLTGFFPCHRYLFLIAIKRVLCSAFLSISSAGWKHPPWGWRWIVTVGNGLHLLDSCAENVIRQWDQMWFSTQKHLWFNADFLMPGCLSVEVASCWKNVC